MSIDKKKLFSLLAVIVLIVGSGTIWYLSSGREPVGPALDGLPPSQEVSVTPPEELDKRVIKSDIVFPVGKLVVSRGRYDYVSGSMQLIIPRLELNCPVLGDTTLETLALGVGLYKYSQTPDIYNTNVSIAGHRDLHGYEFYYMDTITEGDYFYLVYKNKVFQYEYRSTEIIEDDNWDPICCFYDSRITLTTCDPVGTSLRRMVVVGELIAVHDYTEDYTFVSSAEKS